MRNLSCARLGALLVTALLVAATPGLADQAPGGPVQWDEKASAELTHALHHMHDVWNKGDIKSLKNEILGDDVLVTFELDPRTHAPVRLRSKQDIDRFVDEIVNAIDEDAELTQLEMPVVHCKATDTFGICTEECTIHYKDKAGTVVRTDKLLSTAFAVKQPDGWKWIQWHMSVAEQTVPRTEARAFAKPAASGSN
jgi:ketosteroid isomerase-like protein